MLLEDYHLLLDKYIDDRAFRKYCVYSITKC